MATEGSRRLITTVERAADVLLHFAASDQPDLGVTELATDLDLSKAVVHRLLTTLASKGFVEADPETRRYRLGPEVLAVGAAYLARLDLREIALPVMQELSEQTGETATMSIRHGWERLYVDQVTPDREVKMSVVLGQRFPLHAGSSSKAFLAFLEQKDRKAYMDTHDLTILTDQTINDRADLESELDTTLTRGYAISYGERQAGASSVAAPVFDNHGEPAAVLSVCGPLERFRPRVTEIGGLLVDKTTQLSWRLGHRN